MSSVVHIRKSPALLARNVVLLQFIGIIIYFSVSTITDYGFYYNQFSIAATLSYQVVRFVLFLAIELFLFAYLFLHWLSHRYSIHPALLIEEQGVLLKRRTTYTLSPPIEVSVHDGIFGKFFRYGSIMIRDAAHKKPIFLTHISDPATQVKVIKMLQGEAARTRIDSKIDIHTLLDNREDEKLEFKATFRWDMRAGKVNRAIEKATLKTIAAFLNSQGGHLIVGMADNGDPSGLAHDYATLQRQDADGFENHFTNVFKATIGPELRSYVQVSFHQLHGKEVCVLRVFPSDQPAYLKFDNEEAFYIRTGNSTTALQVSQVADYIRSRWGEE